MSKINDIQQLIGVAAFVGFASDSAGSHTAKSRQVLAEKPHGEWWRSQGNEGVRTDVIIEQVESTA